MFLIFYYTNRPLLRDFTAFGQQKDSKQRRLSSGGGRASTLFLTRHYTKQSDGDEMMPRWLKNNVKKKTEETMKKSIE